MLPPTVIVTAEYSPARVGAETMPNVCVMQVSDVDEQMYEGLFQLRVVLSNFHWGDRVFQHVIITVRGRWARASPKSDYDVEDHGGE